MNKKDLVIIGAGGQGREVLWQIIDVNKDAHLYNILGFIDADEALHGKIINGFPVIGAEQWIIDYEKELCVVIGIANPRIRKTIYQNLKECRNICFPNIFAKGVTYSEHISFGQGCIICLSSILTVNVKIGDFFIANSACTIGHDVVIGDFVTFYPAVIVSGNVHIDSNVEIGTGTKIIQGKRIGTDAIIGAGAVVVDDIPAQCTAVGVPAKPIKYRT